MGFMGGPCNMTVKAQARDFSYVFVIFPFSLQNSMPQCPLQYSVLGVAYTAVPSQLYAGHHCQGFCLRAWVHTLATPGTNLHMRYIRRHASLGSA